MTYHGRARTNWSTTTEANAWCGGIVESNVVVVILFVVDSG